MPQPYVDEVREKKAAALRNTAKRPKKQIPHYIEAAQAVLIDKYPDAREVLTVPFVYTILRECNNAILRQFRDDPNSTADMYGFGKYEFVKLKDYRNVAKSEQYYIKFRVSDTAVDRLRKHHGTATPAQLKRIEEADLYIEKLKAKREEYAKDKAEKSKRKGMLGVESSVNYAEQFSDILQKSLS